MGADIENLFRTKCGLWVIASPSQTQKQKPLRAPRGPPRGALSLFFCVIFFLVEDWEVQVHSETLLSSTILHAQPRKLAQMCLRKCSDPSPRTQAFAAAAGLWTQCNPLQGLIMSRALWRKTRIAQKCCWRPPSEWKSQPLPMSPLRPLALAHSLCLKRAR